MAFFDSAMHLHSMERRWDFRVRHGLTERNDKVELGWNILTEIMPGLQKSSGMTEEEEAAKLAEYYAARNADREAQKEARRRKREEQRSNGIRR